MGAHQPDRPTAPGRRGLSESPAVLFGRRKAAPRAAGRVEADASGTTVVASVAVDTGGGHLDHPFSYTVPDHLRSQVSAGVRVTVPFAGSQAGGWVLDVASQPPSAAAALRDVRRVVSPIRVLDAVVAAAARDVADHYGGTLADVLRSAVPPRHAAAEAAYLAHVGAVSAPTTTPADGATDRAAADVAAADVVTTDRAAVTPGGWTGIAGGEAFLRRVALGQAPAAAARLPAVTDAWSAMATVAHHAAASARATLILVPGVGDVALVSDAVAAAGQLRVVALHHDLGPAARWQAFLQILGGHADVVVGTRAAAFAPVQRLGAVVVWDDGDDAYAEPRAPGWHARVVALARARRGATALVLVGHSRSVEAQWLVRRGDLKSLEPPRSARRAAARVVAPRPDDPLETAARVPRVAHRAISEGLTHGPVLVCVARRGYAPGLTCTTCRNPAACRSCAGGRLALSGPHDPPACVWCATPDPAWVCPTCHGTGLRAAAVGGRRTAEELGKAFPGVPVVTSDAGHMVRSVDGTGQLVVATAGAEPVAQGRYAAAVVLDGDATLQRPGLDTPAEAARRWLHVVSLVRGAADGGLVVLVADPAHPVVQAVVADTPVRFADRVCDERIESGLPPATVAAAVTGDTAAVRLAAHVLRGEGNLPDGTPALWSTPAPTGTAVDVLGPVPLPRRGPATGAAGDDRSRLLVLGSREAVVAAVRDLAVQRSARHGPGTLTVRVDPLEL